MKKILLTAGENMPTNYIRALQKLGAEPIIASEHTDPTEFDGLLLCGGGDPDPTLFGEKNQGSYGISTERDQTELTCIHAFLTAEKPILGICRGNQILNVAFGGTLIQHLPTANNHIAPGQDLYHTIHTDGLLRRFYGRKMQVNSSHHQGIGKLGRGLEVMAVATDGVIEAVVHRRLPVVGVQFHPERMENGLPLIKAVLGL